MIRLRLRVPLRFWHRDDLLFLGDDAPPRVVIPARTTLTVLDIAGERVLVQAASGERVPVGRETIRKHAYVPRVAGCPR